MNARPVWRFGAGLDSALRTCGARPSGLVLQQRGARQSSGIDSVTAEVLVARNAERFGPPRCVGRSSGRRRTFPGPSPRTAAKRIPTGFAPPPGKDLSRSSPVVQRDLIFESILAVLATCLYTTPTASVLRGGLKSKTSLLDFTEILEYSSRNPFRITEIIPQNPSQRFHRLVGLLPECLERMRCL